MQNQPFWLFINNKADILIPKCIPSMATEVSPTTEECSLMTEESSPTTEECSLMTEESSPTTEECSSMIEESSPTTEERSLMTEESSSITEKWGSVVCSINCVSKKDFHHLQIGSAGFL